jgi:cell division protease FtsH
MSVLIDEKDLPLQLDVPQAVEAAYAAEMVEAASKLQRGLPVLIECDKDVAPHLFVNVRGRLKGAGLQCLYLDGRPRGEEPVGPGGMQLGLIGTMIAQLREAVRGAVERRVVVLPHLDLLTTSQGGLTNEAREVIPLLYENPELVWLGFKDPSFPLPTVIENLFPHRISLLGIARPRLRHLVTQRDSRKFGKKFNPWALYKYVSGVNAVRLRKLLSTLEGEDYPVDPRNAYKQVRQATLGGTLEVPTIDLEKDIGGYAKVKERLRKEILDVLAFKDRILEADEVARLEELIPRGMIFWGPPGTGKTLFAKAMATALGAALTVVSGPELKSKWVGESEENLRQIFHRARQSAPAIIVFDELDSFASARGTYTGSGVEHSMVNQLLTEMDGFHREELVFVVGTTNFVEILDPALLRPGRFEFHLHIPYPQDEDRKAILQIYDEKMRLQMSPEALEYSVRRTSDRYLTHTGTPFSGDHLNALCRAVARIRVREDRRDATTPDDIERGLTEFDERMEWTDKEALRMATHEAGHFLCSLACPHHPPPERITIRSEMPWAPAYVGFQKDESFRIGRTRNQMLDDLCVLMGGIEAERLLLHDISTGAGGGPHSDLFRASQLAHAMVEVFGMGTGPSTGVRVFRDAKGDREVLSGVQAEAIDRQLNTLLADAQHRAATILRDHHAELERIRDEVLEKKVLEGERVKEIVAAFQKSSPPLAGSSPPSESNGDKAAGRKPVAEGR